MKALTDQPLCTHTDSHRCADTATHGLTYPNGMEGRFCTLHALVQLDLLRGRIRSGREVHLVILEKGA